MAEMQCLIDKIRTRNVIPLPLGNELKNELYWNSTNNNVYLEGNIYLTVYCYYNKKWEGENYIELFLLRVPSKVALLINTAGPKEAINEKQNKLTFS